MLSRRVVAILMMMASGVSGKRILQIRTDLVRLYPFAVQIAMVGPADAVNIYLLIDIITDWINDSFDQKSQSQLLMDNSTNFDSVVLELKESSFRGDTAEPGLYKVSFDAVSLWTRSGNGIPIEPELVLLIQRAAFLEDEQLLTLLQSADESTGLGSNVVDARAFVTSIMTNSTAGSNSTSSLDPLDTETGNDPAMTGMPTNLSTPSPTYLPTNEPTNAPTNPQTEMASSPINEPTESPSTATSDDNDTSRSVASSRGLQWHGLLSFTAAVGSFAAANFN